MKFCSITAALLIAACLFVPSHSALTKPGTCPKVFNTLVAVPPCNDDQECRGSEKCCKFDYGSVCAPPVSAPPIVLIKPGKCPKYFKSFAPPKTCRFDKECLGDDKCCVFAHGSACAPPAPPVSTTLGCPTPLGFGICLEGCVGGCKDGQICCSTGCGRHCTTPVPVKPGVCGSSRIIPVCHDRCRHDGECSGKKKCCPNSCGGSCKVPSFS